jgi:hypothetical protein
MSGENTHNKKVAHEVGSIKFLFPLKHSVLNSPYCQPILELLCNNFRKEWFDWLANIRGMWTADYIIEALKTLPTKYLM